MQTIKVKEIKGPLGKGERKFYAVVDDKGGEFTSFDTKLAEVQPGSVLEIEPEVSGKYINIKTWKLASAGPSGGRAPGDFEREVVELRELVQRALVRNYEAKETQLQARIIADLWIAGKIDAGSRLVDTLKSWLDRLSPGPAIVTGAATASEPDATATAAPVVIERNYGRHFDNLGDFFNACYKEGVTRAEVLQHFKIKEVDVSKINPDELWPLVYEEMIRPLKEKDK